MAEEFESTIPWGNVAEDYINEPQQMVDHVDRFVRSLPSRQPDVAKKRLRFLAGEVTLKEAQAAGKTNQTIEAYRESHGFSLLPSQRALHFLMHFADESFWQPASPYPEDRHRHLTLYDGKGRVLRKLRSQPNIVPVSQPAILSYDEWQYTDEEPTQLHREFHNSGYGFLKRTYTNGNFTQEVTIKKYQDGARIVKFTAPLGNTDERLLLATMAYYDNKFDDRGRVVSAYDDSILRPAIAVELSRVPSGDPLCLDSFTIGRGAYQNGWVNLAPQFQKLGVHASRPSWVGVPTLQGFVRMADDSMLNVNTEFGTLTFPTSIAFDRLWREMQM